MARLTSLPIMEGWQAAGAAPTLLVACQASSDCNPSYPRSPTLFGGSSARKPGSLATAGSVLAPSIRVLVAQRLPSHRMELGDRAIPQAS
jgi:hypothetical protein